MPSACPNTHSLFWLKTIITILIGLVSPYKAALNNWKGSILPLSSHTAAPPQGLNENVTK